ncbi:tyrosine-type recombinase/integrase [Paenarthrobacter sp. NPDC018779]|uniref:tyrosine-type recombinase/integrase n=1 Tax=Paenarthrobacter sp. NPDC018779 TaxID=3364375 RepID=UPI0037CA16C4
MASIHPRGPKKDGSYSYRLMWRDPEHGPSHQTLHTKQEAELWKRLLDANGQSFSVAQRLHDESDLEGPTVAEAIEQHIEQLVDVTPYTIKRYRGALKNHFNGPLGSLKVKGLKNADIVAWIKWMQGRGKSPKTIADKHGLLSAALLTQVRAGTIDRNPCDGVRLPKKRRVGDDGDDINMDDYKAIHARMDPHFQPFLDFLLGSGCRFSEGTALLGKDFVLDANPPLVLITKAHKLGGENEPARYVGDPKSEKSRRRVSLAPSTVAAIAPAVKQALTDGGPVFRMKNGGVMTHQAFYNRAWSKPRDAAGLGPGGDRHVTVHSIRHLHAAIMLAAGMSMYELSTRLGHNSIQMTVDLYAHLMPDAHFRGAEHAAKALGELPVDPTDYDAA